jgi:hypothetical protein
MAALAPPAYDLTFLPDDDDFIDWTRPVKPPLPRASTTSYGYGNVVTIGQGKGCVFSYWAESAFFRPRGLLARGSRCDPWPGAPDRQPS